MEPLPLEEISDREEGEIVEDEYDVVSDCSLTEDSPLNAGKSVSPPEILNGVCLSKTVNLHKRDVSFISCENYRRRMHSRKRRSIRNSLSRVSKTSQCIKSRTSSVVEIVSDSEDEVIDPLYAKQLREALRREPSSDILRNDNLKTRLKVLIDAHSEEEANLDALRNLALLSTVKPSQSDNETESVNNEKPNCKRDMSDSIDPELQELRLEALKSVVIKNHERRKRKVIEESDIACTAADVTTDIDKENDQTVINNKKLKLTVETNASSAESDLPPTVSNSVTIKSPDTLEEDVDILRAVVLTSMSKKLSNKPNKELKVPFEFPKVKPLIINLNADSDSDTENTESTPKNNLKSTVSEFLKTQRAEAEANIKKKVLLTPVSSINKRYDINKSVMKLLPRSQQIEYHKLKQQLLNAHKKVRMRRNSHKLLPNNKKEVNHATNSTRKLSYSKTSTSLTNNNRILINKSGVAKNNTERKSDPAVTNLHTTLNDLQVTKNGRLQMKGKYRSLGPLLNKINKASYERQQHEILIKKLLQEIQLVRTKLGSSHKTFTDLVQQLVKAKSDIDKSVQQFFPSPLNTSVQHVAQKPVAEETKITETVEDTVIKENEIKLDPNDNNKVEELTENFNLPKYKSPLNYRNITTDPVTTICPYDLLGTCKDNECPFVHCS